MPYNRQEIRDIVHIRNGPARGQIGHKNKKAAFAGRLSVGADNLLIL